MDGSDEQPYQSCTSSKWNLAKYIRNLISFTGDAESLSNDNMDLKNRLTASKRQNWRGVLIAAFLLIILVVFVLFTVYFVCRRCINPNVSLNSGERKNYATILNFRMYFSFVGR